MPRLLSEREEPNVLRLGDPVSGCRVGLLYRLPTTAERVEYLGGLLRPEAAGAAGLLELRRRAGLALLLGLEEGSFALPQDGGGARPLSSTPGAPDFEPRWKEFLAERAPEIIEALAWHVFEGYFREGARGEVTKKN